MQDYEFTLKFTFSGSTVNPESYVEQLAEAGCDDALVGIGQNGRIALNFNRESDNAFNAVCSAIKDIKSVIPDAKLIEATPDFVGLSDIAKLIGYSSQNIKNMMLNSGVDFPLPVHEGNASIWHLANVLDWLKKGKNYQIDDSLLEVAKANMQLNITKESFNLDPVIRHQMGAILS
ncbi:MAG: DNA-binding protein [Methylococcaceae bacterium]|nr:DNA-binding protein [Methylococcaceae bacterium]